MRMSPISPQPRFGATLLVHHKVNSHRPSQVLQQLEMALTKFAEDNQDTLLKTIRDGEDLTILVSHPQNSVIDQFVTFMSKNFPLGKRKILSLPEHTLQHTPAEKA